MSCNCVKDTSLSEPIQFCEWCRCPKCGGKNLHISGASWKGDAIPLDWLSVDVVLVAALYALGFAAAFVVPTAMHTQLYVSSAAAAVLALREIAQACGLL